MSGLNKNTLGFIFVIAFTVIASTPAYATTAKDSDLDGIPDDIEITRYNTNPNSTDTDNDGVLDYQEIIDQTDPNDSNSSKLKEVIDENIFNISSRDPINWWIARISGIAALVLFTFVISFGLVMTSKILLKYRFALNSDVLEKHQFIATYLAYSFVFLHFIVLMFDDTVRLKIQEILIPFIANRDFLTVRGYNLNFAIGIGVLAFYFASILVITSRLKNKIISSITWRKIHYSSFIFWVLFMVHGFTAGSDSNEPWMIAIYIWSLLQVGGLIILRVFGKTLFLPKLKTSQTPKAAVLTENIENTENLKK